MDIHKRFYNALYDCFANWQSNIVISLINNDKRYYTYQPLINILSRKPLIIIDKRFYNAFIRLLCQLAKHHYIHKRYYCFCYNKAIIIMYFNYKSKNQSKDKSINNI